MHGLTYSTTATTVAVHNGPICSTCSTPYVGIHTCSVEQLLRAAEQADARASDLRRRAVERFESLNPQPTRGPVDRTASCPCRPENGGSGVCGCILGQSWTC